MNATFRHQAFNLDADKPLIYTALSKHLFFFRMAISKFVLEQGGVPLNPFMVFDYFLLDTVPRDLVREGNNNLVKRSDEVWVFGAVSDGVLAEIQIAKKRASLYVISQSRNLARLSRLPKPRSNWKTKSLT